MNDTIRQYFANYRIAIIFESQAQATYIAYYFNFSPSMFYKKGICSFYSIAPTPTKPATYHFRMSDLVQSRWAKDYTILTFPEFLMLTSNCKIKEVSGFKEPTLEVAVKK